MNFPIGSPTKTNGNRFQNGDILTDVFCRCTSGWKVSPKSLRLDRASESWKCNLSGSNWRHLEVAGNICRSDSEYIYIHIQYVFCLLWTFLSSFKSKALDSIGFFARFGWIMGGISHISGLFRVDTRRPVDFNTPKVKWPMSNLEIGTASHSDTQDHGACV